MKFSTNVNAFREAYQTASYSIDKVKNANFTGMLLVQAMVQNNKGRIQVFSSNGVANSLVKMAGTVEEPGTILVDPREMGKTLPTLDGDEDLHFELKDNRLQMRCGNFRPKCATDDPKLLAEHMKDLPLRAKATLELPAWKLREVIDRTVLFANKDKEVSLTQPFLNNMYLRCGGGILEAFASNNAVLAKSSIVIDETVPELRVDIPAQAIPALQNILADPALKITKDGEVPTIKLILEKDSNGEQRRLCVRTGETFYATSLSSAHIPDRALDSEKNLTAVVAATVQLNREQFVAATRRCEPFVPVFKAAKALRISLKDNVVTFFDRDGEELDKLNGTGETSGEANAVLDLSYISAVLNTSREGTVTLRFGKTGRAVLVSCGSEENGRSFYVVAGMGDPTAAKKEPATVPAPAVSAQAS